VVGIYFLAIVENILTYFFKNRRVLCTLILFLYVGRPDLVLKSSPREKVSLRRINLEGNTHA
jgi:hypothetical protein